MNIFKTTIALIALSSTFRCAATVTDELTYNWGQADTIAHHNVGPGMNYAKLIFHDKPLILWWVEVDLSNPYAKIEQAQSRHSVPDPQRWDVMTHYRENSRPGHQVKVAWNHDFFSYAESVCIGLNICEGEVTWTPYGRSLLSVTEDGKAEVFCADLDAHITTADNTTLGIDYYNAFNGGLYGDCILYNRFNSKTLTEEGRYISLQPLSPWLINGDDIDCKVLEIADTPLQSSAEKYVLFLRGPKLSALDGHISVGDVIKVSQNFRTPKWGVSPARILNAFHGYPSIVHDGQLQDGEYNNFENGREYEKSSRVMAGVSQDKTKLYIATTELSKSSIGVDCIELAAFMVEKGAYDVVNFDSGGSAAIVIDEKMLNLPGRGSVRPVQDAMLAISLAPEDNVADHISFSRPCISPSIVSRTPLRVISFNRYGDIICDNLEGCQFECDPPELGYVDEQGVFHASDIASKGHIIAHKDEKVAKITVCTQPLERIYPVRESILIDNQRQIAIEVQGSSNGIVRDIDPGSFQWVAADDNIASVTDGILTGISNGTTTITGSIGSIRLDVNVTVEIADDIITHTIFNDLSAIKFQKATAIKNDNVNYTALPDGWESGAVIDFDLDSNRSANISFSPDLTLYSLPESIAMGMYDKNGTARRITMQITDAEGTRQNLIVESTLPGDNEYTFTFKNEDGTAYPYYRYPLKLSKVIIGLKTAAMPQSQLAFKSIKAIYPGQSGVKPILTQTEQEHIIRVEGEELVSLIATDSPKLATVSVYDMTGDLLTTQRHITGTGIDEIRTDIKMLTAGIYAAIVEIDGIVVSRSKFIIR